jgi:AcrR family transcriptional regulator
MWVADEASKVAAEDLTARARIRDAALAHFAEHGVKGATIRGVAEAAGVSSGLVRHHFGSKDGLRKACDVYAMETIRRAKNEALVEGRISEAGFIASALRITAPVMRYLARALVDGSPAADALFDEMLNYAEESSGRLAGAGAPASSDPHAHAAVATAMQLGIIVLHHHLARALGKDIFTHEGYRIAGRAMLEIYSRPLLSPEIAAEALSGYESY